jgi:hypothetical protein
MQIFTQTLNVIQNALAYIRKEPGRIDYIFGENDCLPNEIVRDVNDSGTARACVSKLSQFIQGNGLVDQVLGQSSANISQSYNSAISDLSLIVSYFKCVSFRVVFDNSGMPARIYPVPTQKLRRRGISKFRYNELMGERQYIRGHDKYLKAFDPKEHPQERLKRVAWQIKEYGEQWGDIVYHFKKGVGLHADIYPVPDYYSGIDDIESDAGISRLEKRNIQKGWRTPIIVSTGPIDKMVQDDKGKTEYDKFADNMKRFAGEDAAYALHIEGATDAAKPTVTTINIAEILDQTDKATDRVGRKVCRHMGVPPVLVGFETAGKLGDVQELSNCMDLFRLTVIESQDLIKESLTLVFPDKNWEMSKLTLWQAPATDGSAPGAASSTDPTQPGAAPVDKVNDAMRTWGMADINKIQKIIKRYDLGTTNPSDPKALTFEQAAQILKSYGLTDADIDVWIVKPEEL